MLFLSQVSWAAQRAEGDVRAVQMRANACKKSVLMFYRIFFFQTFPPVIRIWHFSSTVLTLSSLCSRIVGDWHPLSFSKPPFIPPAPETLPLQQAQTRLRPCTLDEQFFWRWEISNFSHIWCLSSQPAATVSQPTSTPLSFFFPFDP